MKSHNYIHIMDMCLFFQEFFFQTPEFFFRTPALFSCCSPRSRKSGLNMCIDGLFLSTNKRDYTTSHSIETFTWNLLINDSGSGSQTGNFFAVGFPAGWPPCVSVAHSQSSSWSCPFRFRCSRTLAL